MHRILFNTRRKSGTYSALLRRTMIKEI